MKKLISGFIAGVIVSLAVTTFAAQSFGIKLVINGRDITSTLDVEPQVVDGRVLVPARYVAENLGARVDWDDATRTVTITSGSTAPSTPAPAPTPTPSAPVVGTAAIYSAMPDKASYESGTNAIVKVSATKATVRVAITDSSGSTVAESTQFTTDTQGNYFNISIPVSGNGVIEYKAFGVNSAGSASVAKAVSIRVEAPKATTEIKEITLEKSTVERDATVYVTVKTSNNVDKIAVADDNNKVIRNKTTTSSESGSTYTWTINFTAEDSNGTYTYYIYAYDKDGKYIQQKFTVKVASSTSSSSSDDTLYIHSVDVTNKNDIYGTYSWVEIKVETSKDIEKIEIRDKYDNYIADYSGYSSQTSNYYIFETDFKSDSDGTHYIWAYDRDNYVVKKSFTYTYK